MLLTLASHLMASGGSSGKKSPEWGDKNGNDGQQTPHFGNYRGYYAIRRETDGANHDARLQVILSWLNLQHGPDARRLKRVLDVGCNSGQVTAQFCQALHDKGLEYMVAVDVDRELILLAASMARRLGIQTEKQESTSQPQVSNPLRVLGSGRVGRGMSAPRKRLRLDDGERDQERAKKQAADIPPVVRFLQSNWVHNDDLFKRHGSECPGTMTRMQWRDMAEVAQEDALGYHLILALSVTKWIHINHADTGLRRFFARVASCLDQDGILILEPQAYKSYKHTLKVTAATSQPRRNFYGLRVMPDDFAWILTVELGLLGPFCIREKGKDGELGRHHAASGSILILPSSTASVRQIDAYIQPPLDSLSRHCRDRRAALLALPLPEDPPAHDLDTIPWVPRSRETSG